MNIEIWYDCVLPETYVAIDGQWMQRGDIYGFLYSVRGAVLQAWLGPNGTWTGLKRQLRELSRGDAVHLIFHGRDLDFSDVHQVLQSETWITLEYQSWDSVKIWSQRLESAWKEMELLLQSEPPFENLRDEIRKKISEKKRKWREDIYDDKTMAEAASDGNDCCFLFSPWNSLLEYERGIKKLTRSMRRASDMICCVLDTPEQQEQLERMLEQYGEHSVRLTQKGSSEADEMKEKYGKAILLRLEMDCFLDCLSVLRTYWEQRPELEKMHRELRGKMETWNPSTTAEFRSRRHMEEEIEQLKRKKLWLTKKQKTFEELNNLLSGSLLTESADGGVHR